MVNDYIVVRRIHSAVTMNIINKSLDIVLIFAELSNLCFRIVFNDSSSRIMRCGCLSTVGVAGELCSSLQVHPQPNNKVVNLSVGNFVCCPVMKMETCQGRTQPFTYC